MRLVQLEDIGVFFPGRTLFERSDWAVFRGQRVGLVGVNGAGKSTLLRLSQMKLRRRMANWC